MIQDKYNAISSNVEHLNANEGPLSTWTFAIKDNFNLKDTIMASSSKLLAGYESVYSATVIDLLIQQGAQILCKTSMDEFGMGGDNTTAYSGPVLNPLDTNRVSGGSSGGSAALVASKDVRAALGTDTGDSIRKPASYCGVVGVKPSFGRISRYGVMAFASSLDTVGYFTQNVDDAITLLPILSGRDNMDLTSVDKPFEMITLRDLKGMKIGIFDSVHEVMDPLVISETVEKLKKSLSILGAETVSVSMPLNLLRSIYPVYAVVSSVEALSNHASLDGVRFGAQVPGDSLEDIMSETRTQNLGYQVRKRYLFGAYSSTGEKFETVFTKAKRVRRVLVDHYESMLSEVDAIIVMASGQIAPLIEGNVPISGDAYLIGENHLALQNFSGHPSMTIPFGVYENMPLGINITSKHFDEATLFEIARHLEGENI